MSTTKKTIPAIPDPEVSDRPRRRRFKAEYKLSILRELDGCHAPGESGAVLRREGLYSSHISAWRRQREAGELQGLRSRKRGRPAVVRNPLEADVTRLERDNHRLQEELRKARLIIEVQKKLAELLRLPEGDSSGSLE